MVSLRSSAGKANSYLPHQVSDDYLVGFVEGEGMFYVGVVPSRETKTGWQVIHFFKVSQNPSGRKILEELQRRVGCGYIRLNSKNDPTDRSLAFIVRDLPSLQNCILPLFEGKLIIKSDAFEKFKQVIELVSQKKHLTKEGMEKILDISYSMNTRKRRFSKEKIISAY